MSKDDDRAVLIWREIPDLNPSPTNLLTSKLEHQIQLQWRRNNNKIKGVTLSVSVNAGSSNFGCVSMAAGDKQGGDDIDFAPTTAQLLKYPLAIVALIPKSVSLFAAGAVAGAVAKSFTAPLDRVKLLMQVHFVFLVLIALFFTYVFNS